MPFGVDVKTRMFTRCARRCCLCLKQCGINIEAAHIIDEAAGGSNDEENGIPLCFDCHQEVGSYSDKHPRGNKMRPEELRARRDKVYALVENGKFLASRGTMWFSGTGTPGNDIGVDGDFYLNIENGDVYQKLAGTW